MNIIKLEQLKQYNCLKKKRMTWVLKEKVVCQPTNQHQPVQTEIQRNFSIAEEEQIYVTTNVLNCFYMRKFVKVLLFII